MKCIFVEGKTIPEVWEKSIIECWNTGTEFKTQYDKPTDPPSKDVTAILHIKEPISEPRIHRAFPGGLEDLEKYRSEVLYGVHDHWINPKEGKWEYTYHKRLFEYEVPCSCHNPIDKTGYCLVCKGTGILHINQIDHCIDMLKKMWIYSPCPSSYMESMGRFRKLRASLSSKIMV